MILPSVSVVTLTRDRPDDLLRAMRSVADQIQVRAEHVIVGDDARYLADPTFVGRLRDEFGSAIIDNVPRTADDESGYLPARLGRLRNHGVTLSTGAYVAQLDDDNTFDRHHLVSLLQTLQHSPGAAVAHSWRRLVGPDGCPFIPTGLDPWHPSPQWQASSYQELLSLGIFVPGSNVVRDTFRSEGRVIARVDTSEFLVQRELFDRIRFSESFSAARQRLQWTEDYAFALDLARSGVEVACSRLATLSYQMGGYSNSAVLTAGPRIDATQAIG